jgi:hypothetical protein
LSTLHYPLSWSNGVGEAKEVFSLQMSGDRGKKNVGYMPNVSIVTRVEGKKVKHEESSPKYYFWTYIKKKTIDFLDLYDKINPLTLCCRSLLLVHVRLAPS